MQQSVERSLNELKGNPQSSFRELTSKLIEETRHRLIEEAEKYEGSEELKIKKQHHAENFGKLRRGSQRVTLIGDAGPLSL